MKRKWIVILLLLLTLVLGGIAVYVALNSSGKPDFVGYDCILNNTPNAVTCDYHEGPSDATCSNFIRNVTIAAGETFCIEMNECGKCAQLDCEAIGGIRADGGVCTATPTTTTRTATARACGTTCTATSQCGSGHTCEDSPYDSINGNVCVKNTCRAPAACTNGPCGTPINCGDPCGAVANGDRPTICPQDHTCVTAFGSSICVKNTCMAPNVCSPDANCGNPPASTTTTSTATMTQTATITTTSQDAPPECNDGIDNDGDGKTDCTPSNPDPGCFPDGNGGGGTCNPNDDSELNGLPKTALISDDVDRVLVAFVILVLGYAMLRFKALDGVVELVDRRRRRQLVVE